VAHAVERSLHFVDSEPYGLAQFDVGNQSGFAPVEETASAHVKVGADLILSHQLVVRCLRE